MDTAIKDAIARRAATVTTRSEMFETLPAKCLALHTIDNAIFGKRDDTDLSEAILLAVDGLIADVMLRAEEEQMCRVLAEMAAEGGRADWTAESIYAARREAGLPFGAG